MKEQIEVLRRDLHELAEKFGIMSPIVLKKSEELDKVLNKYNLLVVKGILKTEIVRRTQKLTAGDAKN
ncbi:aspartyl-phosphate phosphatase Spo0E family protein [Paenibacillus oralis]|uniref:aspartyl-phosphate phosphatase Spo0E family protein n=1 Tax=Paenibacillus oralis TaxID=2490856 RepID=UPI001FECF90F|nr:aspartyl-phosphate phosphatase Spo0E family protein [Paenibacillus oralis]